MGDWKATKVGINLKIKSLAGIPYRRLAHRAWLMSGEEFWNYQANTFRSIYNFARTRVPYYRARPDIYPPLPPDEGNVLEFLYSLPVLNKQTVKENNEQFWPRPPLRLTKIHTTSGTTGTPLRCPETIWEKGLAQAVWEEWLLHICGTRSPRTIGLSGFMIPSKSDLYWLDRISGNAYLSIYSMDSSNRDAIIKLFKEVNPKLIWGYASAVNQLATLLEDSFKNSMGTRIGIVTSEVLQPQWRTTIEQSLCKLYNYYSSQEGTHDVIQCTNGRMHINPLIGIIELVNDDYLPIKAKEFGRVLVTGLLRKSMPLIRYEIGDTVESTGYDTSCSCGLSWPTIGMIEGRSEDLVKTRDGRHIGYLCFHATKDLKGIKEAQIIQIGYESFICNIVKIDSEPVENSYLESAIRSQIEKRLQLKVNIEFRYLPSIPRGTRGKFKAVLVTLQESDL